MGTEMKKSRQRFTELKKSVDRLRTERDRAEGSLEKAFSDLQKGFGVKTVPEAKKLLKKMDKEVDQLERAFQSALAAFEEKWEGQL